MKCHQNMIHKMHSKALYKIIQLIIPQNNIFVNQMTNGRFFHPHTNRKPRLNDQPGLSYHYAIFSIAQRAASCSARFLLLPEPVPIVVPLSLTSTSNRLSWSGPDSPIKA